VTRLVTDMMLIPRGDVGLVDGAKRGSFDAWPDVEGMMPAHADRDVFADLEFPVVCRTSEEVPSVDLWVVSE